MSNNFFEAVKEDVPYMPLVKNLRFRMHKL